MTTTEKLEWIRNRVCTFSLEFNENRANYETLDQYFAELDEYFVGRKSGVDPEIRAACIEKNQLIVIQLYPRTPVGFVRFWHWDIDAIIEASYQYVVAELGT